MSSDSMANSQKEELTIHVFSLEKGNFITIIWTRMFIFGGHDIREGTLDSLWMVELTKVQEGEHKGAEFGDAVEKKVQWNKLETTGKDKPGKIYDVNNLLGPIAHHSSVVFSEKMYLFGGSNQQRKVHNHTFWQLDLKNLRWDVIFARGDIPGNREDHTAVIYEGAMVVFGGFLPNGERTNDIYMYFFKENKWEKVSVLGLDLPKARAGHSAIVFGDSMVIFGGRDEEANKLNDIWVFNFTSYQWEEIHAYDPPVPRSGHSACLYKDMMLVFGGMFEVTKELDDMHLFDFRNKRWITFFEEQNSPTRLK